MIRYTAKTVENKIICFKTVKTDYLKIEVIEKCVAHFVEVAKTTMRKIALKKVNFL